MWISKKQYRNLLDQIDHARRTAADAQFRSERALGKIEGAYPNHPFETPGLSSRVKQLEDKVRHDPDLTIPMQVLGKTTFIGLPTFVRVPVTTVLGKVVDILGLRYVEGIEPSITQVSKQEEK